MACVNGAARVTERTGGMASVMRIKSVDSGDAQTLGEMEVAVEAGQEMKVNGTCSDGEEQYPM